MYLVLQNVFFSSEPEVQILDYLTQQHKLFIAIATSHAFSTTYGWLYKAYLQVVEDLGKGKQDHLPEVNPYIFSLFRTLLVISHSAWSSSSQLHDVH